MLASRLLSVARQSLPPEFVAMAQTQNSSSGTSLVINKPTGTQEGDLMIGVMIASGAASWTGDTSWDELGEYNSFPKLRIAIKTAGASEGSSYTFTASASNTLTGAILTYRNAAYDTIGSSTTGADPLVLSSISVAANNSILLAIGARTTGGITLGTPTDMTARVTDNDATGPSFIVCDQDVSAGASGTRSMSTGSSSGVVGIMLSIKPA